MLLLVSGKSQLFTIIIDSHPEAKPPGEETPPMTPVTERGGLSYPAPPPGAIY